MAKKPTLKMPKVVEQRVRTSDLLAHYDGQVRTLANIWGISVQAVYGWGEFIPKTRTYEATTLHPALKKKLVSFPVKFKRVVKEVVRYARVQ